MHFNRFVALGSVACLLPWRQLLYRQRLESGTPGSRPSGVSLVNFHFTNTFCGLYDKTRFASMSELLSIFIRNWAWVWHVSSMGRFQQSGPLTTETEKPVNENFGGFRLHWNPVYVSTDSRRRGNGLKAQTDRRQAGLATFLWKSLFRAVSQQPSTTSSVLHIDHTQPMPYTGSCLSWIHLGKYVVG